jgi:ParB family transcriptional regulator, chromosome partitioning protein
MSRKDSRGMFANVLGRLDQEPTAQAQAPAKTNSPHLMKVAAGVRQIQEKGEALDRLLKDGDHVVDLDPTEIAPSSIPDRFNGAYDAAAIEAISTSMSERGQIVPGLVRPMKDGHHRYQIVFGRRRLAAARSLGIRFRAVVRELTDEEAIVFQGEENSNRNDLSFIEKCAFALSQDKAGYRRDVICASLATGKSHVSEMLRIANAVPLQTLHLIGPSPDVGRRRWLEFVDAWALQEEPEQKVSLALAGNRSASAPADRFAVALASLKERASGQPPTKFNVTVRGLVLATVSHPKSGVRVDFTKAAPVGFVEFLSSRMEELHGEFMKQQENKG